MAPWAAPMSPTDPGRSTNVAGLPQFTAHPTSRAPAHHQTPIQGDRAIEEGQVTVPDHPYRSARYPGAQPGTLAYLRATIPTAALANDGRRCSATRSRSPWGRRPLASDTRQLVAGMTANLSAQLEGAVTRDFVADIVRAVLDESRQSAQDRSVDSVMLEARLRLERFIRARSSG
jgi:hypothetical protein